MNWYKKAQNKQVLENIYHVSPNFSAELENIFKNIPKEEKGLKSYILKWIKNSPPQSIQDVNNIKNNTMNTTVKGTVREVYKSEIEGKWSRVCLY